MINDYIEVKECVYKDELYSVRDNGAVMRHLREGKKARKDDGVWTFGIKNPQNGYMHFGNANGHRVHIIVATAFYGARDSKVYVVDHIDTNRCNNRVENLRWFTKLENALNNEITRNKIIYICESIEAFVENPSILRERLVGEPSLEWMRAVTKEEAATAFENLKQYWAEQAKSPKPLMGGKLNDGVYRKQQTITQSVPTSSNKENTSTAIEGKSDFIVSDDEWKNISSSLQEILPNEWGVPEEWMSTQNDASEAEIRPFESDLIKATSPNIAWQKNCKTPAHFPCCPKSIGSSPLQKYYNQLVIGENYSITMCSEFNLMVQKTVNKAFTKNVNAIIVLSGTNDFYRLSKIYCKDGKFIHEHLKKYRSSQHEQVLEHFASLQDLTLEEYRLKELFSESNLVKAKSPETAWQMNWKTPTDFLCCPDTIGNSPIEEYYNQIVIGEAYNTTMYYGSNEVQRVVDKAHTKEDTIIILSCNPNPNSIKPYALSKIHYFEGKFIHESLGTFFEEDGGRKYFTLEQGLEWTGGDTFDDYCL